MITLLAESITSTATSETPDNQDEYSVTNGVHLARFNQIESLRLYRSVYLFEGWSDEQDGEILPEIRGRSVWLVFEHQADYDSQWAGIESIAEKIRCVADTSGRASASWESAEAFIYLLAGQSSEIEQKYRLQRVTYSSFISSTRWLSLRMKSRKVWATSDSLRPFR